MMSLPTLTMVSRSDDDDAFAFSTPIRTVAVIGAGISGIASAAHVLRQGLDVTVFERSSVPGGVWHYDPTLPAEPPYPNDRPPGPAPNGIESSSSGPSPCPSSRTFEEASLAHAPPGPCYNGLRNNIPTPVMRTTLLDWPEGTPDYISHDVVEKYIEDLAVHTGVHDRIHYGTRVESVRKRAESDDNTAAASPRWTVHTRTLRRATAAEIGGDGSTGSYELVDRTWSFDAVVVASGRYHEPRIPDLPGLREWKQRMPDSVLHSKRYRSPDPFRGKTVFLVGGGVSALDIAREIVGVARATYQSARGGKFDLPAAMFAPGVKRVGPVDRFVLNSSDSGDGNATGGSGTIVLQDGRVVPDIDVVVLCTGYITSYPFLGSLQAPAVPKEAADGEVVITSDGCMTHNLHKDMFYIPDPTLVFVGVPYHASAFSLFDFQAAVVARVLAGKALLPSRRRMRREYAARRSAIAEGGAVFHSLMRRDVEYMRDLQGWVNRDAVRLGHEPMDAIDEKWVRSYYAFVEEMKGRRWEEDGCRDDEVPLVGKELRGDVRVVSAVHS